MWRSGAHGQKPTDRFCQILPEEALPARFQQVRTILRNALSPSFSPILLAFAVVFRNLRYVFVTVLSHITTNSSGPLICIVPGFFNSLAGTFLAAQPELVRIVLTYPTLDVFPRAHSHLAAGIGFPL